MSGLPTLGPGDPLPAWMAALDRTCFGTPWGPLSEREWALLLPEAGFARWSVVPDIGEAELLRVAVDPSRRGAGLGRRLLEASEAALRARGIHTLLLEVRAGNGPARRLYEAAGWRARGLRKGYYSGQEDAVLYGKALGGSFPF